MMTLRRFSEKPSTIFTITSLYLADLSKAQGNQELYTHKSPQKLRILCEHALIESAISFYRVFYGNPQSICIAQPYNCMI